MLNPSLIIRTEQMKALAEASLTKRIVAGLRSALADHLIILPEGEITIGAVPEGYLRWLVEAGIAKARNHGFVTQRGACEFVMLMFLVAPNFDQHAPIHRRLLNPAVPMASRIELLWKQMSDSDISAARRKYDPCAWLVLSSVDE